MVALSFADREFDTVILDDVLVGAADGAEAVKEATRVLAPDGRLLLLSSLSGLDAEKHQKQLAGWAAAAGLRLAQPRFIPSIKPDWLLAVATLADDKSVAA